MHITLVNVIYNFGFTELRAVQCQQELPEELQSIEKYRHPCRMTFNEKYIRGFRFFLNFSVDLDSSVPIATLYGMDSPGIGFR